jgi:pyrimidine operon attenuation protein/uracil phosphoribosyltransferase
MSDVTPINHADSSVLLAPEVDDLLLQVRGLVLVRDLLAERGATRAEIDAHTDELARARHRLAVIIDGAAPDAPVFGEAA